MTADQNVERKLDQSVVFIHHSVRFPDPSIPNTPEAFGLDPAVADRELLSLGKLKIFPKEVWIEIFGEYDKSPIFELKCIRSGLQRFIDLYTFPFLAGAARALPYGKLIPFMDTSKVLQTQFAKAKDAYCERLDDLVNASVRFWDAKCPKLFQIDKQDILQAIRHRFENFQTFENSFGIDVLALKLDSLDAGSVAIANAEEAREIERARQEMARESVTQLRERTQAFQASIVTDLRERVHAAFSGIMQKMGDNSFNQKSIKALQGVLKDFHALNFMGDTKLEAFITDQESKLASIEAKKLKADESLMGQFAEYIAQQTSILDGLKSEEVNSVVDSFLGVERKSIAAADIDEPAENAVETGAAVAAPQQEEMLLFGPDATDDSEPF